MTLMTKIKNSSSLKISSILGMEESPLYIPHSSAVFICQKICHVEMSKIKSTTDISERFFFFFTKLAIYTLLIFNFLYLSSSHHILGYISG